MLNRYSKSFRSTRRLQDNVARHHKLTVGTLVTLLAGARDPRSRDQKLESDAAKFEITRLLPADGSHWQYRIKDTETGRERVVLEDQIAPSH